MASGNGPDGDTQHPLRGVVFCCTSILPEDRIAITGIAEEMGASLKLDLTSDVTHLIVGELQTPKYRFVAREREEVRCVLIDFVWAVREAWMAGGDVSLAELEARHRAPPLLDCRVCITGFEDPDQRREIERQAVAAGAEYRGDLRKDCTHLVCFSPAGPKYTSARQWGGIACVSIEWLLWSIKRGMCLDEACFDPLLPPEARGRGAWNKTQATQQQDGATSPGLKRVRTDEKSVAGARKLRRTASTRFSTGDVWGDIVPAAPSPLLAAAATADEMASGHGTDDDSLVGDALGQNQNSNSSRASSTLRGLADRQSAAVSKPPPRGLFHGVRFLIHGFDERRKTLLQQHLEAQDAEICTDAAGAESQNGPESAASSFTIVPYNSASEDVASTPRMPNDDLVTELWLEKCLHKKAFIEPDSQPVNRPFKHPTPGFAKLQVSSTAFEGVDLLHVTKVIQLLGATYQESLTKTVSVLVCNDDSLNRQKTRHAISWGIPVVKVDWLWDCVASGELKLWSDYLIHPHMQTAIGGFKESQPRTDSTEGQGNQQHPRRQLLGRSLPGSNSRALPALPVVRDSFSSKRSESKGPADNDSAADSFAMMPSDQLHQADPLQEISPNLSRPASASPIKSLRQGSKDILSPANRTEQDEHQQTLTALSSLLAKTRERRPSVEARTAVAAVGVGPEGQQATRRRRPLLGRARSDLSTRSMASRAGSVGSMNTDDLGTPMDPPSHKTSPLKPRAKRGAANGAAEPVEGRDEQQQGAADDDDEHDLTADLLRSHEELEALERASEDQEAPLMTQIGYDDPDASVWRARLMRKMTGGTLGGDDGEGDDEGWGNGANVDGAAGAATVTPKPKNLLRDAGEESVSKRTRLNTTAK